MTKSFTRCNVCERDLRACNHFPGRTYDGVLCVIPEPLPEYCRAQARAKHSDVYAQFMAAAASGINGNSDIEMGQEKIAILAIKGADALLAGYLEAIGEPNDAFRDIGEDS